ncbi:MAG: hypothetical protein WCO12_03445 [bacterium]
MTLRNFLDLRKKEQPEIVVVEKVVFKARQWKLEILKIFMVISTVSLTIWGISKADDAIFSDSSIAPITEVAVTPENNFSAIGYVTDISDSSMTIDDSQVSDNSADASYVFNTGHINKIENNDYLPLAISDIKLGDKIIVQGTRVNGVDEIHRIISFATAATTTATTTDATSTVATTTATSTDNSNSTSTDLVATDTASTTATSTGIINTVINAVKSAVETVVNAFLGDETNTSTSTGAVPATQTSTSDSSSSSTEESPTNTPDTTIPPPSTSDTSTQAPASETSPQ